ncbi:2-C-methyl-D-erythritol 2,4-cyclodiphosphate synthase [Zavarzinella formosa]|uniref:2-C-methyl-D-erythritol 2,4-cyclodiphosphate synthase n=1 Tax=Zavarzinella formosa TaxID=360055 RepID=UPI0002D2B8F3|nr:2-C-methyl-D-erythritol 2,4-cyclodiphosphate synthase [Zavarzinella formosa]
MRIGSGHDTHRLIPGRRLILGGVDVPFSHGLDGHSDADVVLHAVTDALLGAVGLGDIGDSYPDSDPAYKNQDSSFFVKETLAKLNRMGWQAVNVDVTIFAEVPKLGPIKQDIKAKVAELLKLPADCVNVKAKTGEEVGHIGRGEAIGCHAVALVGRLDSGGSASN